MKKKIILLAVLCLAALLAFVPQTAFADATPKPTVTVSLSGLENAGVYYVTLLSERPSTGPYRVYDPLGEYPGSCAPEDEDYDIWLKFAEYEDSDGFHFLQYFRKCDEKDVFEWSYFPPATFKILIYLPEKDAFIESGVCTRYAFDSYFQATVALSQIENGAVYTDSVTVTKNYNYLWEAVSLVARIVATIGVEILLALLFRYTAKKQLLLILYTNIATQIALNIALNIVAFLLGWFAFYAIYILAELLVFIIEGLVYTVYMPRFTEGKKRIWLVWIYAFVANLLSLAAGGVLAYFIPGIIF